MTGLVGAMLGALLGGGAFIAVLGWRGIASQWRFDRLPIQTKWSVDRFWLRLGIGGVGFVVITLLTGWLVGGLVGGVAGFSSLTLLSARTNRNRAVTQMEAIASWIEMLRDTMSAASGLTETLKTTAEAAPAALRGPVRQLAARAERESLTDALTWFADEVGHAVADTVVVTLNLATTRQTGSLQELLSEIAESTRQEVSMRLKMEASRARQFTSARFIAGVVAVFAVGMMAFSRSYLEPFNSPSGQVALAVIGALFIGSGMALVKMSRFEDPPRILDIRQSVDVEAGEL